MCGRKFFLNYSEYFLKFYYKKNLIKIFLKGVAKISCPHLG
jgi:hypothetical protein